MRVVTLQPSIIDFIFGEPAILTLEDGVWAESTLLKISARRGETGNSVVQVRNVLGSRRVLAPRSSAAGRSGIRRAVLEFAISDSSRVRVQLPVSFSVPSRSDSMDARVDSTLALKR